MRTTVFCIPKITYARTPGFLSPRQETRTYVPKIFTSVPLAPPPRNTYLRTRIFLSSSRCHDPPSETDVKTSPDALKAQPRNWPLPGGQQENTDISNKYRARTKGRAFFLRNGPGCWVRQRGRDRHCECNFTRTHFMKHSCDIQQAFLTAAIITSRVLR